MIQILLNISQIFLKIIEIIKFLTIAFIITIIEAIKFVIGLF